MISRDFVHAFLLGQQVAGVSQTDAQTNLQAWLDGQSSSYLLPGEKERILADLPSYEINVSDLNISPVLYTPVTVVATPVQQVGG